MSRTNKLMMNRLRDLREERDLKQKDIATYLCMSQTGYAAYETGENDIPTWVLLKLSEYYSTSIDYILFNTDERVKYKNSKIDKKDLVR